MFRFPPSESKVEMAPFLIDCDSNLRCLDERPKVLGNRCIMHKDTAKIAPSFSSLFSTKTSKIFSTVPMDLFRLLMSECRRAGRMHNRVNLASLVPISIDFSQYYVLSLSNFSRDRSVDASYTRPEADANDPKNPWTWYIFDTAANPHIEACAENRDKLSFSIIVCHFPPCPDFRHSTLLCKKLLGCIFLAFTYGFWVLVSGWNKFEITLRNMLTSKNELQTAERAV